MQAGLCGQTPRLNSESEHSTLLDSPVMAGKHEPPGTGPWVPNQNGSESRGWASGFPGSILLGCRSAPDEL